MNYSPGMKVSAYHLCTLPLPHLSSWLVSPGKELVPSSGALIFVAATQGTPLEHLAMVASGTYTHSSRRTVREKEFLTHRARQEAIDRCLEGLSVKGAYSLIFTIS